MSSVSKLEGLVLVLVGLALMASPSAAHDAADFVLQAEGLTVQEVYDGHPEVGCNEDGGNRNLAAGSLMIIPQVPSEPNVYHLQRINADGSLDDLLTVTVHASDDHYICRVSSDPCSGTIWFTANCAGCFHMEVWRVDGLPANVCSSNDFFRRSGLPGR